MAHEMTLIHAELRTLRKANEALAKRRRAKRTRLQAGGALTAEDVRALIAAKDAGGRQLGDGTSEGGALEAGPAT